MSDRPNPLASVMQQAAAAKERARPPAGAHAKAPAKKRTSAPTADTVEAIEVSSQVRQAGLDPAINRRRSSRPRFEDVYRRATFFIHPDQLSAIDAITYRLGIGKSEFVRAAIEEKLSRET